MKTPMRGTCGENDATVDENTPLTQDWGKPCAISTSTHPGIAFVKSMEGLEAMWYEKSPIHITNQSRDA
jgi:hypothetical protein